MGLQTSGTKRPFWQRLSHILVSLAGQGPQDLQGCVSIVFYNGKRTSGSPNLIIYSTFWGPENWVPRGLPTLAWRVLTISLGSVRALFSLGRPDPPSYRNVVFYERKLPPGSAYFMCYDTFCGPVSWPQGAGRPDCMITYAGLVRWRTAVQLIEWLMG